MANADPPPEKNILPRLAGEDPKEDRNEVRPEQRGEVRREAAKPSAPKKEEQPAPPKPEQEEEAGQQTILMDRPSTFEQLVDGILKRHKI